MPQTYRQLLDDYAKRGLLDKYREDLVSTLGPSNDPLQFDDSVMNADAQVVLQKLAEYQAQNQPQVATPNPNKRFTSDVSDYVAGRAEWAKEALTGAAEGAAYAIPYGAASVASAVVAPLTEGMQVEEIAGAAAKSDIAPLRAAGEFLQEGGRRIKGDQQAYNKEMLDLPLGERFSRSASNVLGGIATLATAPFGIGPAGDPARAREVGSGLIQGPVGYYASLLDPSMTVETAIADPFALMAEAIPFAKSVGSTMRAAAKTSKNSKVAAALEHTANIVDPELTPAASAGSVERGRRPSKAVDSLAGEGASSASVATAVDKMNPKVPLPKTSGAATHFDAPVWSTKVGQGLRHAFVGSLVLEPTALLFGAPASAGIAGALMVPAARKAMAAVAKSRGMTVGELHASMDRVFNDPLAVDSPDVADALSTLVAAPRHRAASAAAFKSAIATMVERGAALQEGGPEIPEPSRLVVPFVTTGDGRIHNDPAGTKKWINYVAEHEDARVRAAGLAILAREEKRVANTMRWALKGQEQTALRRVLRWQEDLAEATKGKERLTAKRAVLEAKIAALDLPDGTLEAVRLYRDKRRAFDAEMASSPARPQALAAFNKALDEYQHARFLNSNKVARAQKLYEKTLNEVRDVMSPELLERAEQLKDSLDNYEWSNEYQSWVGLYRQQQAMAKTLRDFDNMGSFESTYRGLASKRSKSMTERPLRFTNAKGLMRAFRESNERMVEIRDKVTRGIDLSQRERSIVNRHHAILEMIDEGVMEYMLLDRERQSVLAKMDGVTEALGGTPTQFRRAILDELQTLRAEHAEAIKAAKRERGSREWMEGKKEGALQDMMRAAKERDDAIAEIEQIEPRIKELQAMEASLRETERATRDARRQGKAAIAMEAAIERVDEGITAQEAIAASVEGMINTTLEGSWMVEDAVKAIGRAESLAAKRKSAVAKNAKEFPLSVAQGMDNLGVARLEAPSRKIPLRWYERQIDEWVDQVALLSESLSPFGSPMDKNGIKRLFAMSMFSDSVVHMVNKRAVGAFIKRVARDSKELQSTISAKIGDMVAASIKTDLWKEPEVNGVRFTAYISEWLDSLPSKERREVIAETARSIGNWAADHIQAHMMQGNASAELARQIPPGLAQQLVVGENATMAIAGSSFIDWATGGRSASMVPFDVELIRQRLIEAGAITADGTVMNNAVLDAFAQAAVQKTGISTWGDEAVAARLTGAGVSEWLKSLSEFIDPTGASVSGRNRMERSKRASGIGGAAMVAGAAAGVGGAIIGAPLVATAGGAALVAGGLMRAMEPKFAHLTDFLSTVRGDLSQSIGYAPESIWVHRAMASALDAQLAMLKTTSPIESVFKKGLTALSLGTSFMNMLSNDAIYSFATGSMPGQLFREMFAVGDEIALWRRGEANKYQQAKWDAFAATGLMESSWVSDVMRDFGKGDPAKGKGAQLYQDSMRFFLTAYAAQDGYAKAASFSRQYDGLHGVVGQLPPGYGLSLNVGHNRWSSIRQTASGLEVKRGNAWQPIGDGSRELSELIGKGAATWPAKTFFDFNQLPGFIKRGSGVFSLFSPLFGWAFKAIDVPGKPGIGHAAVNYFPSSQWITDDPNLLRLKAQQAMDLSIRRAVSMAFMRAPGRIRTKQEQELAEIMSYGIPQFSLITAPTETSPGTYGPQGNIVALEPSLVGMSLLAEFQMGVADMLGFGPETAIELANASIAELTPEQREAMRLRRMWWRYATGKLGSPADLVRLVGVGGNFAMPAIAGALSSPYRDVNWKRIGANLASGVLGKTTINTMDVIIGLMDPDSQTTTREIVQGEDGQRPEDAFLWVVRSLTGIGAREIKSGQIKKDFQRVERTMKRTLVNGANKEIRRLQARLSRPDVSPEEADEIVRKITVLKEMVRERRGFITETMRESRAAARGEGANQ
jgi:hypothetical protein